MKTAIQELIDELQAERRNIPIIEGWVHSFYKTIIDNAEAKLEKEKEQIINAYCDGFKQGSEGDRIMSEEYYNETYNQTK